MTDLRPNTFNSLRDKIVIVTGSSSGIGLEIAKKFSSLKATVVIACRDERRGIEIHNQINGNSEYINLDLSSFKSIDRFISSINSKFSKVDILINNAGVMGPPFSKTDEQLELTFGVNYIGYYLLTNKMMPMLKEVKGSRVVNMSSIAQYKVKHIDWDNLNSQIQYDKWEAYALSNLFRMMFTVELEKKLREKSYQTISLACHPGVTITNLTRYMPRIARSSVIAKLLNHSIFQTPSKAAMPALMAATSAIVTGGEFVGLDTKRQVRGNPKVVEPNELVFNQVLREKLWNKSVEITGFDLE